MQVLSDATQLAAALSPLRQRVLAELQTPQSASSLAPRLGLSRQALNYHLRELEREGLLALVEERPRRGCVERFLKVTSRAFVVSPAVLGRLADDPASARDRFSSAYLLTAASRVIRDVATLSERAQAAGERLATCTIDTDIRFASPAAFRAFIEEAAASIATLAAKYDDPAQRSRPFRVVFASHPVVTKTEAQAVADTRRKGRRQLHPRNTARRSS